MSVLKRNKWSTAFRAKKISSNAFTIPWRLEYENFIQEAKEAVRNSDLEKALD